MPSPLPHFLRQNLLPVSLLALMLIGASVLKHKSVIFPEFGALAAGILVCRLPLWRERLADIVVFPVLAACAATALNLSALPLALKEALVLGVILGLLRFFRSAMVPTLSAGLLPLLLHFTSVYYPLSVAASSVVLASVALYDKKRFPTERRVIPTQHPHFLIAFWVLAYAWLLLALMTGYIYLAVPPVLVAAFELMKVRGQDSFTKGVLLAGCAWGGVLIYHLIPEPVVAGIVIFLGVSLAIAQTGLVLPPAYALGLLPLILPQSQQWRYGLSAALGSLVFLGLAKLISEWLPAHLFPPSGSATAHEL